MNPHIYILSCLFTFVLIHNMSSFRSLSSLSCYDHQIKRPIKFVLLKKRPIKYFCDCLFRDMKYNHISLFTAVNSIQILLYPSILNDCCLPLGRQHTILDIRCLLVPSPSTELCMCDEISILENFWMFVRSVAQFLFELLRNINIKQSSFILDSRRKLISVCLLFTEV